MMVVDMRIRISRIASARHNGRYEDEQHMLYAAGWGAPAGWVTRYITIGRRRMMTGTSPCYRLGYMFHHYLPAIIPPWLMGSRILVPPFPP